VRLAVFADIHANRQAFAACLADARARGAERMILLGDYVGYGADPQWAVDTVMALVENGASAVRGNHDSAIGIRSDSMNAEAQAALAGRPPLARDVSAMAGPLVRPGVVTEGFAVGDCTAADCIMPQLRPSLVIGGNDSVII